MPSMGLGLQLGRSGVGVSGLNFSALTALPSGRQSAVTTAANTAAATLSVTPQSIIDALSVGRGLCSMLPNDGCLLASTGGAVTVQGDPVGAIRSWTGVELATQSNASLRPTSGADGIIGDGAKELALINLVAGNLDAVAVLDAAVNPSQNGFWHVGTAGGAWVPFSDGKIYDHMGTSTRIESSSAVSGAFNKAIYQPSLESGLLTLRWNGSTVASQSGLTNALISTPRLLNNGITGYSGTVSAFALNTSNYSEAQRNAIREFCRNYYGVIY